MSRRLAGRQYSTMAFVGVLIVVLGLTGIMTVVMRPSLPSLQTTAPSTSAEGLQLAASVNSTRLIPGEKLNVSLSIFNTLPEVKSVLPSDVWQFKGVPVALWYPCYFGLPAQMVILKGNYSLQDLRTVANMTWGYECMEGVSVHHILFQPGSDWVNLTGTYDVTGATQTLGPFSLSLSFVTGGYWDMQNLSLMLNKPILGDGGNPKVPPPYVPFTPGEYTVAVADEWGQAAIVHVSVATNSGTSASGGIGLLSIEVIKPYTPAGPTVAITLENNEGCCMTNLTAVLGLNKNYTFRFPTVSPGHPLGQGHFASSVLTLVGAGINSSATYSLTITGATQDTSFSYAARTRIPQAFNPLIYLDSVVCEAPGGYAPCWGDDAYVFQCVDLTSGPSSPYECVQKITSTFPPYPSYTVAVTIPVANQLNEPPWANCEWNVPGISPGQGFAYCIPVNSTSFMMADLSPTPP